MKHKFEKLAQDGMTLTEILQSRLDEIEAKINSDFPLISDLKDKNKNFLSTLYHIAQNSSADALTPEAKIYSTLHFTQRDNPCSQMESLSFITQSTKNLRIANTLIILPYQQKLQNILR